MGKNFFDQYSLLHFSTGVVAYFFGIGFVDWFVIHAAFEFIENQECVMKLINRIKIWPGGKNYADSAINSIGDQVFAMLGWYAAYLLDKYGNKYGWYQRHLA
jgi:hypothetical protein